MTTENYAHIAILLIFIIWSLEFIAFIASCGYEAVKEEVGGFPVMGAFKENKIGFILSITKMTIKIAWRRFVKSFKNA